MPGLEIRMPVELLAGEPRLVVQTRLMDVELVTEQEADNTGDARIACQTIEDLALLFELEDGADLIGTRFGNDAVGC
jgi:hypothetical protein